MQQPAQNIEELFFAALELDSPAARSAFLDRVCGDAEVRRRVEQLLVHDARVKDFLEVPASAPTGASARDPLASAVQPTTVIGPYKLLEAIGEGGMGAVYMAEQTAPVRRTVALKLIKAGLDSRQILARFEAERQALAIMDHPNIAKVLDVGTTAIGLPYFVMELVRGVPITEFCDERRLTPQERLELFIPVCHAVQHAHQKGVIHRDLKPSNVLVGQYDGQPVPKVIDFGVAKATGQKLTEATLFTGFGAVVGTPEYMSPEQAELDHLDIDTRSDVYSLGVLLYELLTGTTPLVRPRLKEVAILEVLRVIREEDPQRPSTRLSSTEELPSIAARRNVEPRKLTGLVRGDLDWIVMRTLEKDRNRRYQTANDLAADVRRYLDDEPVHASPPSTTYRLRKLARRNNGLLAAASAILLALMAGTTVAIWQAIRAQAAEGLAEKRLAAESIARKQADANLQKARQAVDEYYSLVSESRLLDVPGLQPLRKELLESALRYYQGMLDQNSDDLVVLTDVAVTSLRVGVIYHVLDRNDDAMSAIEVALPIVERIRTAESPEAARYQRMLAGTFRGGRITNATAMPADPVAAHRSLSRLLEHWEALARSHPDEKDFQHDLAFLRYFLAKLESGLGATGDRAAVRRGTMHARKAITILEALDHSEPGGTRHEHILASIYGDLGSLLRESGDLRGADRAFAKKNALNGELIRRYPNDPSIRFRRAGQLVSDALRVSKAQPEESEKILREAIAEFSALIREFPAEPTYPVAREAAQTHRIRLFVGRLNRPRDAVSAFREMIRDLEKAAENSDAHTNVLALLGWKCRDAAAYFASFPDLRREAESLRRRDVAAWERVTKSQPGDARYAEHLAHAHRHIGFDEHQAGRGAAAEEAFEAAIGVLERATARFPGSSTLRSLLHDTSSHLAQWRAHRRARSALRPEVHASLRHEMGLDPKSASARNELADALLIRAADLNAQEKWDEAIADCREVLRVRPDRAEAHRLLGEALRRKGATDEAIEVYEQALQETPSWAVSQPRPLARIQRDLHATLVAAGRPAEAEHLFRRSRTAWEKQAEGGSSHSRWELAWFLVTWPDPRRHDPRRAIELAQQLVDDDPAASHFWRVLGVARLRVRNWPAAIAELDEANYRLNGGHAWTWFFLAMAHWESGSKDEARWWYDRATRSLEECRGHADIGEILQFQAEAAELLGHAKATMPNGQAAFAPES